MIAYGAMVHTALEATEDLDGASVEVLDLRSLVPLDEEAILASVRKTSKVLVVDEANATCAAGAQVAALIAERGFEDLDGPVRRVATPDVPIPFSPPLEQAVLPSVDRVREAAVSSSRTETATVDVVMPQMGVSVSEGTIVAWRKQVGDWVEYEEPICDISTDKIDTEVPSPAAGRAGRDRRRARRDRRRSGTVLARIATDARPGEAARQRGRGLAAPRRHRRPPGRAEPDAERRASAARATARSSRASPPSTTSTSSRSRAPAAAGACASRTSSPLARTARPRGARAPRAAAAHRVALPARARPGGRGACRAAATPAPRPASRCRACAARSAST